MKTLINICACLLLLVASCTSTDDSVKLLENPANTAWISVKALVYQDDDSLAVERCVNGQYIDLIAFHGNKFDEFNFEFGQQMNREWKWSGKDNFFEGVSTRRFISVDSSQLVLEDYLPGSYFGKNAKQVRVRFIYQRFSNETGFNFDEMLSKLNNKVFESSLDGKPALFSFSGQKQVSYKKNEVLAFGGITLLSANEEKTLQHSWQLIGFNGLCLLNLKINYHENSQDGEINYILRKVEDDNLSCIQVDNCKQTTITFKETGSIPGNQLTSKLKQWLTGEWNNGKTGIIFNTDTTTFSLSPSSDLSKSTGIWKLSVDNKYVILTDTMALQLDTINKRLTDTETGMIYTRK